eukprot:2485343-Pleurochrysis_carterae.AAC.2
MKSAYVRLCACVRACACVCVCARGDGCARERAGAAHLAQPPVSLTVDAVEPAIRVLRERRDLKDLRHAQEPAPETSTAKSDEADVQQTKA